MLSLKFNNSHPFLHLKYLLHGLQLNLSNFNNWGGILNPTSQYLKLLTQKYNYQYKSQLLHSVSLPHGSMPLIYFLHSEKLNALLRNSFESWLMAYLQLILKLKYLPSKVTLTLKYSGINHQNVFVSVTTLMNTKCWNLFQRSSTSRIFLKGKVRSAIHYTTKGRLVSTDIDILERFNA